MSVAPPTEPLTAAPQPLPSLWRNRDYMLLWSGQMVSQLGSGVSMLAYPLLILAITGSPARAGIVAALFAVPYLIFSLPAGALIDRWDRKKVMIRCDIGRALALGSIPVAYALGHLTEVQLYITATIEGSLFVWFNIAEVACLPRVVANAQIPTAAAQNEGGSIATALISPPLGGILFGLARSLPFLTDAISYAFSVLSLSLIRTEFQGERTVERRRLRTEIAEGISWLWGNHLIRYMAFLTGGLNLTNAATGLLVIVLARGQGASPGVIGLAFSVASVGGIGGALLAPRIQKRFGFGQVIVSMTWLAALLYPLYAVAPNTLLLGVVMALSFLTGPIYNAVQFGYRVQIIPDVLAGRVNSSFRLVAFGFQPLGAALCGFLITAVGAHQTVLVFAAVGILLAIVTTLNGQVRNARPVVQVEAA